MNDLISFLPPDVTSALVAFVAFVTALRVLVRWLQKLATSTKTTVDDEALDRVAAVLDRIDRVLDWVSVGPTSRKR